MHGAFCTHILENTNENEDTIEFFDEALMDSVNPLEGKAVIKNMHDVMVAF